MVHSLNLLQHLCAQKSNILAPLTTKSLATHTKIQECYQLAP